MIKNKELKNIRPAKGGVKLRRKEPRKPPVERKNPEVYSDAIKDVPGADLPPPNEDAIKIVAKLNDLRQDLMITMKEFHGLMKDSKLPENRSVKERTIEQSIINRMVNLAGKIDRYSKGEGSLAVCVFAVRLSLSIRDASNHLAYELQNLKERVNVLENKEDG